MSIKVTCKWSKEKINKDDAYAVILEHHKKNTYFKSEEYYKLYIAEEKAKENIVYSFNNILNKNKYSKLSRLIKNKIKIWLEEGYLYQEIDYTLHHYYDLFYSVKGKGEPYLVQVISNKLLSGKDSFQSKNKAKSKRTNSELNSEVENKINNYKYNKKGCDITKWI